MLFLSSAISASIAFKSFLHVFGVPLIVIPHVLSLSKNLCLVVLPHILLSCENFILKRIYLLPFRTFSLYSTELLLFDLIHRDFNLLISASMLFKSVP